jgi:uncharacterized membrane protein
MIRAFSHLLLWLLLLAVALLGVSLGLVAMIMSGLWWVYNLPLRIIMEGRKWAR